ncbi:MAG: lysophospholipid acyltransferase family protein [Bacilli bacterium]|jgi:1-acyl-sn-glycerol-3-phosphate acyltransferase
MKSNRVSKLKKNLKVWFFKLHSFVVFFSFWPKAIYIDKNLKKAIKKRRDPLIFIYNHFSRFDTLCLWFIFLRKRIHFIATDELRAKAISRFFFDWNGIITLEGKKITIRSYNQIISVIRDGYNIAIAPEGHINRNAKLDPFFSGPAKISSFTNTDILPVYIVPNRKVFWQRQFVYIGHPISPLGYKDGNELSKKTEEEMKKLQFIANFDRRSYVYLLPVDENIHEKELQTDFYKKYDLKKATHQYHASKSAWYYLEKICLNQFGIELKKEDISFTSEGKPLHPQIHFNLTHDKDLIGIVISGHDCAIDLQKGFDNEIKKWVLGENKKKLFPRTTSGRYFSKKIKFNKMTYTLGVRTKNKIKIVKKIKPL